MIEDVTIYQWIGSLGFPIVVALYHMIYQERSLRKLTEAVNRLIDMYIMHPPQVQQTINR